MGFETDSRQQAGTRGNGDAASPVLHRLYGLGCNIDRHALHVWWRLATMRKGGMKMKKPMIIISAVLMWCALLFVMLCSGCAWLNNGNNPNPPSDCHELEISNKFLSFSANIKYNLSESNLPFTFRLNPSSGQYYRFLFDITSNSVLRLTLNGAEFSVSNGVACLQRSHVKTLEMDGFEENRRSCVGPFVAVKVWNLEHENLRWRIEGWETVDFINRVKFAIDGTCYPRRLLSPTPLCILEMKDVKVRNVTNIAY